MIKKIKPYAKAIVGGVAGALGALQVAMGDDSVSVSEWIDIAEAFLIGTGVVYAIPNGKKDRAPKA